MKCGDVIKSAFTKDKNVWWVGSYFYFLALLYFSPSEKSAYNDLVTETDQEVEKMLISGLRERFPSTLFIGEESVASGDKCQMTAAKTWIIDPIDGTTNFINSNPHICTILAFVVDQAGDRPCWALSEYNC